MTKYYDQSKQALKKLVADPVAEETHWIPACESLSAQVSSSRLHPVKGLQVGLLFFTIILSAAFAFTHLMFVQAGYDWGYEFVEKIWGQPDGIEQGLLAFLSLGCVILPGAFGLSYGACSSHVSGITKAWTWSPYLLLAICAAGYTTMILSGGRAYDSDSLFGMLIEVAISGVCLNIGIRLGSWAYSNLKGRVQAARMFLWSLVGLLPFAILNFVHGQMSLPTEIAGYFGSILLGSCIAASVAKSKDKTAGIIAALFAMLPIFLANLLNLSSNVLAWGLDLLEWRALVSAIALNIVAVSAICAGGVLAAFLPKNRPPFQ